MKYSIMYSAVLMALALSACERPTVVTAPATVIAVPGPAGPAGATESTDDTGAQGQHGRTRGDTVVIIPAAPPAR